MDTEDDKLDVISDELLLELKQLSEKASEGKWWVDSHGCYVLTFTESDTLLVFEPQNYHKKAVRHPETGNLSHWRNDWDASYIVTACPDNIKKLIKRLEEAEAKLKEHNLM